MDHIVKPLDANEGMWRCACGNTFHSDHGYAICPDDEKTWAMITRHNAVIGMITLSGEVEIIATNHHQPSRGDAVEAWIREQRDKYKGAVTDSDWHGYWALDGLLDDYRLHADTGVPLESKEPMQ